MGILQVLWWNLLVNIIWSDAPLEGQSHMWFKIHTTKQNTFSFRNIFLSQRVFPLQGSVFKERVVSSDEGQSSQTLPEQHTGPLSNLLCFPLQTSEPTHSYTQILKCKPLPCFHRMTFILSLWSRQYRGQISEKWDLPFATSPSVSGMKW